jgi:integrase
MDTGEATTPMSPWYRGGGVRTFGHVRRKLSPRRETALDKKSTNPSGENIMKKTDKERRYQFMDGTTKMNIHLGILPDWKYLEYRRRLDTLKRSMRLGEPLDEITSKWLLEISDTLHAKIAATGLCTPRLDKTLGSFLNGFMRELKKQPNTLDNYRASIKNLIDYFGESKPVSAITVADAEGYRRHLQETGRMDGKGGYGQNSIWKKMQHAKKFFGEMVYRKMIIDNPFERLTVPKVDEHDRKIYVSEEYALLAIEHAPTWEWKLIIALWRFGGLRRNEPLLLKWSDGLWDKRLIRVRSNKKKDERLVPIFPEIAKPLDECRAGVTEGVEWLIDQACPKQYRNGTRACGMKGANLVSVFDDITAKAGLSVIPMVGNNMRASAVKDLYSGKYPELRGRIDLIGKILGHSPQVAMTYYERFQMDDFKELTDSFQAKQCRENDANRQTAVIADSERDSGSAESSAKSGASTEITDALGARDVIRP